MAANEPVSSRANRRTALRRDGWQRARGVVAAAALLLGVFSAAAVAAPAQAASAAAGTGAGGAAGHPYRHGLVPMLGKGATPLVTCSSRCLKFGGGIGGVGVTTGKEQVYLVFWGTQWGTQGTNSHGYATFSGDPHGVAPDLQAFFKGLGSSTDKWSGVMTQYCQGVATGATRCPSTAPHVAYPTGGALAGVWQDTSAKSPAQSTGHQLAAEAEKAATHFGNTTTSSNRNAQYVIVSPTGTNPDNYQGSGFCAWHDYTGDATLDGGGGATGPLLAFTNLPYIPDAGASCGAGVVDGQLLDGVTIVGGHEYAETITDQFPAGGWTSSSGAENGDLCAWKTSGAGRMVDITLSTGSFAVQGTWSNLASNGAGGCADGHSIVTRR
jgi:serine protease